MNQLSDSFGASGRSSTTNTRATYMLAGQAIAVHTNGTFYYLLNDHLGSASMTVNRTNGNVDQRQRFLPFGGTRTSLGGNLAGRGYTGHLHNDGVGLIYTAEWLCAGLCAQPRPFGHLSRISSPSPAYAIMPTIHKREETEMTTAVLTQIQHLADQLTPLEQAQLVQYLTPRLVQALAPMPPKPNGQRGAMPPEWQTLFAVGDTLPEPIHETSLTQTVLDMRR